MELEKYRRKHGLKGSLFRGGELRSEDLERPVRVSGALKLKHGPSVRAAHMQGKTRAGWGRIGHDNGDGPGHGVS
jgi:hypothetical protein